ncbi:MAG: hypothetical protein Q7J20_10655 [Candidatus Nitrotoga sp.]|nr:hypothetical protein [Candidatus Nitrotoga sp.]MDO9448327.1 hypothetical protein [Candidatus Nitrotoga sp.]MDP3498142.1 hypothetical protein [Candidatus Nitrotoga sp.]
MAGSAWPEVWALAWETENASESVLVSIDKRNCMGISPIFLSRNDGKLGRANYIVQSSLTKKISKFPYERMYRNQGMRIHHRGRQALCGRNKASIDRIGYYVS